MRNNDYDNDDEDKDENDGTTQNGSCERKKLQRALNFFQAFGILRSIIYSRGKCEQLILRNSQFNPDPRTTHFPQPSLRTVDHNFFAGSGRTMAPHGKGSQHGNDIRTVRKEKNAARQPAGWPAGQPAAAYFKVNVRRALQTPRNVKYFLFRTGRPVASLKRPSVRITNSCSRNMFNLLCAPDDSPAQVFLGVYRISDETSLLHISYRLNIL